MLFCMEPRYYTCAISHQNNCAPLSMIIPPQSTTPSISQSLACLSFPPFQLITPPLSIKHSPIPAMMMQRLSETLLPNVKEAKRLASIDSGDVLPELCVHSAWPKDHRPLD